MKFQLILQFKATDVHDFDDLVALEENLIRSLSPRSAMDGHDFGSGEFNIFVLTDRPRESFMLCANAIPRHYWDRLKAAYREIGKDEFVILRRKSLPAFKI